MNETTTAPGEKQQLTRTLKSAVVNRVIGVSFGLMMITGTALAQENSTAADVCSKGFVGIGNNLIQLLLYGLPPFIGAVALGMLGFAALTTKYEEKAKWKSRAFDTAKMAGLFVIFPLLVEGLAFATKSNALQCIQF